MKIDVDIVAIIVAIASFVGSYAVMKKTVSILEATVSEIKKDFKGIGSKLGNISDKVIRHEAILESKNDRP